MSLSIAAIERSGTNPMKTRMFDKDGALYLQIPRIMAEGLTAGDVEIRRIGEGFIVTLPAAS